MEKSEKKKELIRSIKFLLFSISAGLIQMSSFALFNLQEFLLRYKPARE